MHNQLKKFLPMRGLKMLNDKDLLVENIVPPALNGNYRCNIDIKSLIIYDLANLTRDDLEICGCDINPTTKFGDKGELLSQEIIVDNWYYNQQYEPEFSIGLTLRQLDIAASVKEEKLFAEFYSIFVRLNKGEG